MENDRLVLSQEKRSNRSCFTQSPEAWIREHIDGIGKDAFTDYPVVSWTLKGMIHKGWYPFAEAEAPLEDAVGWSRL